MKSPGVLSISNNSPEQLKDNRVLLNYKKILPIHYLMQTLLCYRLMSDVTSLIQMNCII